MSPGKIVVRISPNSAWSALANFTAGWPSLNIWFCASLMKLSAQSYSPFLYFQF